jgi:hypothetical protein
VTVQSSACYDKFYDGTVAKQACESSACSDDLFERRRMNSSACCGGSVEKDTRGNIESGAAGAAAARKLS